MKSLQLMDDNSVSDSVDEESGVLTADLLAACKNNDTKRAQDLLAKGILPDYSEPESGWTCLNWSVHNGNPVLTRALIRAGAAAGYKRASAAAAQAFNRLTTDSPLHWSAYRGDLGITWILLKEGYSPNDIDKMGNTATHLAAANGHERVLDALIRDGADVHIQNKFKNTPLDVANSPECLNLLKNAKAKPAPSTDEAGEMHSKNMQRILEAENFLIEVTGCIEAKEDEGSLRDRQQPETIRNGGHDDRRNDAREVNGPQAPAEVREDKGERSGEEKLEQIAAEDLLLPDTKHNGSKGENEMKEERKENSDDGINPCGGKYDSAEDGDFNGDCYMNEKEGGLLAQVERIRDAIAGVEALCICEDLVAEAQLMIDGLLLRHSIEKQTAAVARAGPVLTQEVYTTVVNRLMLLLKRADGNPRIPRKLQRRAKALVDKSNAEYWLQVTTQRLLKVECGDTRYLGDMAKLEACINKAINFGAQVDLVSGSQLLLKRLTTEVEISTAIESFPTVRLPIEVMPKDYWQPEDVGRVEETKEYPLPPVDTEGKTLDYVWIPSDSLRSLSAACERLSTALVEPEGLNSALVEQGFQSLQEHQRVRHEPVLGVKFTSILEAAMLQEKDAVDREKAIVAVKKLAKKFKKKKGGKKKGGKKKGDKKKK